MLQTGALPVKFEQIDLTEVSATLGKDSLREAITASLIGLAVVALFLLLIYRFLGLVAIVGLALNAAFLYAVILLFDVTLTLPGFAGMILAIGVAADANIVIFERIKEEAAQRNSVRAAISSGYRKGFATIIDANVVTAITALILFAVATGGVRGFAFMLLLGTAISIFTAVFATRALLGLLAGFSWFDNPRFMGASAQKMARWQMFDAVGKRRIWFTIAGVLIALSIGSLIFKGLNLGIDFRGGSQITLQTDRPTDIAAVRREAAELGAGRHRRPGAWDRGLGRLHPVPDQDRAAQQRGAAPADRLARGRPRRSGRGGTKRLGQLLAPDSARRDLRDLDLVPADHDLHHAPLPMALRGADPSDDRERRRDRARDLLAVRPGGERRDGCRVPDDHRLLDLRHDHHLRPRPREPAADAAFHDQRDRQHVAVGDRPPVAGDDDHHAACRSVRSICSAARCCRTSPSRS